MVLIWIIKGVILDIPIWWKDGSLNFMLMEEVILEEEFGLIMAMIISIIIPMLVQLSTFL